RRRLAALELQALRPLATPAAGASGAAAQSDDERRHETARLDEQAETLESELARHSAPLRRQRSLPAPAALLGRLPRAPPAHAALGELVQFPPYRFAASMSENRGTPDHYLAMVMQSGGAIGVADLGDAGPIDTAASALTKSLRQPGNAPDVGRALGQLLMA